MSQEFDTADVLRLEVQEGWPGLPNLVQNPGNGQSTWDWRTEAGRLLPAPVAGFRLSSTDTGQGRAPVAYTDVAINPAGSGLEVQLNINHDGFHLAGGTLQTAPMANVEFIDAAGTSLGFGPEWTLPGPGTVEELVTTVPVGCVKVRLRIAFVVSGVNEAIGSYFDFSGVQVYVGAASEIPTTTGEPAWVDVLGPTHDITVTREGMNVGEVKATILDSTLDPAADDLIRPGKRCRLLAEAAPGDWQPVGHASILNGEVTWDYLAQNVPDQRRTKIVMTTVDAMSTLAGQKRPQGVAAVDDLPAVLVGTGVPYAVNGETEALPDGGETVVAINENASAADQVAVTRDTVLGYAWIDTAGVLQVWDRDQIPTTPAGAPTADVYSDIQIGYDTARCINEVNIKFLRLNPDTGESEEVTYGPFRNEESIREWGVQTAEFTIQGLAEETTQITAYAQAILDANSTPVRRITQVVIPISTTARISAWAFTDLYDLLTVETPEGGTQDLRVTSVAHAITAEKWILTLGFETEGSVAAPTFTPSPGGGADGKTIGQLLRPVGEVTSWLCAKADIPAGWLPLDGSTFDGAAYPELAALLGGTTLPDFTDRVIVGAGSKALLTTGGNATVTLTTGNLPPHNHGSAGSHNHTLSFSAATGSSGGNLPRGTNTNNGTGTGPIAADGAHTHASVGNSDPVDILNPWVALWPCVRAR